MVEVAVVWGMLAGVGVGVGGGGGGWKGRRSCPAPGMGERTPLASWCSEGKTMEVVVMINMALLELLRYLWN